MVPFGDAFALARDLEKLLLMNIPRPRTRRSSCLTLVALAAAVGTACGPGEPRTDAERLARGREIIERMSTKLGSAKAFSVSTREVRDQVKASGEAQVINLTRESAIRRPDRAYFKTSGDVQSEGWYDGVGLTVALHKQKVFAQARMPETLDKALDSMYERYGVPTPIGDYFYSSPAKALLADSTTGGWVGREVVDGQQADHLAFKDKGVNWEIWVAATGDPLPLKARSQFTETKRLRQIDMAFSDWNFAPTIADDRFTPKVPADYEGIAMVQRARVLRNIPDDAPAPAPAAAPVKK
jgi:hypothetical protein